MKGLKAVLRYYLAGALTPFLGGLVLLALGYRLNIWETIITGWFLLLLGLFVIGPGLAIWYYDRDVSATVAPASQAVLAVCPRCKNRIPSESKFCPECGEKLRP